jgi:lipopolysaccharide/colanic/teichoic acid biosynthesis glycosyltransferase
MKRLFDITLSILLIFILSPIFILISLLIFFNTGRPILFIQKRPGLKSKIFNIYKFRTMNSKKDINGNLLDDFSRLTLFGKILRKTSLDEIPQLFNVLQGNMSFVGPRPLLVDYLEFYSNNQLKRHDVKPGITGWAQINGRNCISWEEKFKYDVWYVQNQSFFLDIKILCITIFNVFSSKNINSNDELTMKKFKGKV